MTAGAWWALGVAGTFAVIDWMAVARDRRPVEYVCKPATLAALLAMAVVLDPRHGDRRDWFVVALALSMLGDVFLMLPGRRGSGRGSESDLFIAGLASFLLAHVCFAVGLDLHPGPAWAFAVGAAAMAAVALTLGRRVVAGARAHDRRLAAPVTLYIGVIGVMVASAIGSGSAWAAAGALSFQFSDLLIGWTRFLRPLRHGRVAIMVTYHVGQALLVLSLTR